MGSVAPASRRGNAEKKATRCPLEVACQDALAVQLVERLIDVFPRIPKSAVSRRGGSDPRRCSDLCTQASHSARLILGTPCSSGGSTCRSVLARSEEDPSSLTVLQEEQDVGSHPRLRGFLSKAERYSHARTSDSQARSVRRNVLPRESPERASFRLYWKAPKTLDVSRSSDSSSGG